jgi:thioesterase domain-containing protein
VQLEEDPDLEFSEEQIRSTATEYIRAMKTVQAHGPYNLIGQCQGAYIAFEMVQQLERSGEEVVFLGLLDAWTEENTRHKWAFHVHLALWRIRHLDIRELKEALGRVRSKIIHREASTPQVAPEPVSRPKRKTRNERYFPGKDFVPAVCSCPITVFRVKDQAWFRKKDLTHGWSNRTRGGVTVRTVPGCHSTLTRQPHVKVLAAMIAARLAEAASRTGELLQFADAG